MLRKLLFASLSLASFGATAQTNFRPGYVVLPAGDTLRGEIDSRSDMRSAVLCRFRPITGAAATEYEPSQLLGYGLTDGRNYQSRILPNADHSTVFMRVVVAGPLSLYQFKNQENQEVYYAQKSFANAVQPLIQRDTTIIQYNPQTRVESRTLTREYPFRNILWEMMTDCPTAQTNLTKVELNQTQLVNAVVAYNRCVGGTAYVAAMRKTTTKLLALAGTYQATVNYNRGGEQDLNSTSKPTFGLGIEMQPSKFNDHLSLLIQALYTKTKYHAQYQAVGSLGPGYERTVDISLSAVHLPLLLRYSLTKGVVRPYVQAGVIFSLNTQRQGQQTDYLPRLSTRPTVETIDLRSYGIGGSIGAGLLIPAGKGGVTVEARANSFDNTSEARGLISGARSFSLLAGYTFGK